MGNTTLYLIIAMTVALVGVVGDSFIKHSAGAIGGMFTKSFLIGLIIYALTAFGWFLVMKHVKLGTLGVFYALTTVVAIFLVSIFYFKESYNFVEIVGAILAVIALIILGKYA